jgi:DNA-directed RNA polymerase subunit RPC12/RpoP
MALISCAECNRQVSDRAIACPHCGCPVASPVKARPPVAATKPKAATQEANRTDSDFSAFPDRLQSRASQATRGGLPGGQPTPDEIRATENDVGGKRLTAAEVYGKHRSEVLRCAVIVFLGIAGTVAVGIAVDPFVAIGVAFVTLIIALGVVSWFVGMMRGSTVNQKTAKGKEAVVDTNKRGHVGTFMTMFWGGQVIGLGIVVIMQLGTLNSRIDKLEHPSLLPRPALESFETSRLKQRIRVIEDKLGIVHGPLD